MQTTRPSPSRVALTSSLLALGAWLAASAVFAFGQGRGEVVETWNALGLISALLLDGAAFFTALAALLNRDRSAYAIGGLIASLLLLPFGLFAVFFVSIVHAL